MSHFLECRIYQNRKSTRHQHSAIGACSSSEVLGVSRTLFAVMPVPQALLQFSRRKNPAGVNSGVNNGADPANHRNRRWCGV
jgi:hypothetical protein